MEKEWDEKGNTRKRKRKGERGRDEVIWGEREEREVGREEKEEKEGDEKGKTGRKRKVGREEKA